MSGKILSASCNPSHHVKLVTTFLFVVTLAQFIYYIILLKHFKNTFAVFQAAWLYFSIGALLILFVVLFYGLYAVWKRIDRHANIFRGWVLFLGSSLFFAGFFHIIGQIRDDFLFYSACSRGFHGFKDDKERLPDETAETSHEICRKLFDKLLISWIILWLCHTAIFLLLLLCLRSYRRRYFQSHIEDQAGDQEREQQHNQQDDPLKPPTIVVHSASVD